MAPNRLPPLDGHRVLVTRAGHQAAELSDRLVALGAEVLLEPAIRIGPPPNWAPVDDALARLAHYDWVVFSSANGVDFLVERLRATLGNVGNLSSVKLAAIGPGTAERLGRYDLQAQLVPKLHRAEALAAALTVEARGKRFLLARASRGREILADTLRSAGGEVDQIVVYTSADVGPDEPSVREVRKRLARGEIDWVTVTSSAIARSVVRLFGDALTRTRLASISPITSATLEELGFSPAVEAQAYTMQGLVEAIHRGESP